MNNKLLTRIKKLETLTERLEQAIQDIRASCSCLKDLEDNFDIPNCEPLCGDCNRELCLCELEIEEDNIMICPEPPEEEDEIPDHDD